MPRGGRRRRRRVQEEAAGEGADLLARSIIELLQLPPLLSDLDSVALRKHPDIAQPLASCAQRRLGCHPFAGLVQLPLSLCQRPLSVGQLFPEPTLALTLGLEPRECIGVLSPARLGQRLDRLLAAAAVLWLPGYVRRKQAAAARPDRAPWRA